jgi:probable phosphoglycerate mutase
MKKIYFVRHGQSEANVDGIRRGAKTQLTNKGRGQAQVVARRFKDIPIDIVLSSPYNRAYETGQIMAEINNVQLEKVNIACERRLPESVLGRSRNDADIQKLVREIFEDWTTNIQSHKDAETFNEMINRADRLIELVNNRDENNIVITSHSFFGKIFVQRVLLGEHINAKQFLHTALRMKPSNTGITVFQIEDDGEWVLLNWNDDAHLGEL